MGGSGQITNNLINFDLIKIIQFSLKMGGSVVSLMRAVFVETLPPMGGYMGGWMGQWVNGWGQVK